MLRSMHSPDVSFRGEYPVKKTLRWHPFNRHHRSPVLSVVICPLQDIKTNKCYIKNIQASKSFNI